MKPFELELLSIQSHVGVITVYDGSCRPVMKLTGGDIGIRTLEFRTTLHLQSGVQH